MKNIKSIINGLLVLLTVSACNIDERVDPNRRFIEQCTE